MCNMTSEGMGGVEGRSDMEGGSELVGKLQTKAPKAKTTAEYKVEIVERRPEGEEKPVKNRKILKLGQKQKRSVVKKIKVKKQLKRKTLIR